MSKPGANDPCPCGSGKKYKKCCRDSAASGTYTQGERESAYAKLSDFIDERFPDEEEDAYHEFWGRFMEQAGELPEDVTRSSDFIEEAWFAADEPLEDGRTVLDVLLAEGDFTPGERAFLSGLSRSSMHLYEVVEVAPGISLMLRDALEGGTVTVRERTASRTINRFDWLATRVVPRGPSGGAEMEGGVLSIPRMFTEDLVASLRRDRDEFLETEPGANITAFYKTLVPMFHDIWVGSMLDPQVPDLRNTDDEELVFTRVHFDLLDDAALVRSLGGCAELTADGDGRWYWSGTGSKAKRVSLGVVRRTDGDLVLETNSVERGSRGRAVLETAAGAAIRYRITSHENATLALKRRVREQALGGGDDDTDEPEVSAIPMDVQEALVLEYQGKHYRSWVDEPVPALDGLTPRKAASQWKMRGRVEELIHGLEAMYQDALRARRPAYDPSWMWNELGLADKTAPFLLPPLAHERVAESVPGTAEVSHAVAERLRRATDFSDARSTLSAEDFAVDLELQRFLREHKPSANDSGAEGSVAAPYLRLMVNFDLHRRKVFWVDEALGYMLGQTDLDVLGRELRVPFASFAIVFTDRHVLSLAERALSREDNCPASGHILKVATVYVTEDHRGDRRVLELTFAFDALGADLPTLLRHEIPLEDETPVQGYLDGVDPLPVVEAAPVDANPTRGLLRTTINAILYATSAGVEHEPRKPKGDAPAGPAQKRLFTSDEVFFLPGSIDITHVRQMQELERVPSGCEVLRRFMVRGHWRRANKGWVDQSLRWVQPYWKGPDMAAIIERTYRLKE